MSIFIRVNFLALVVLTGIGCTAKTSSQSTTQSGQWVQDPQKKIALVVGEAGAQNGNYWVYAYPTNVPTGIAFIVGNLQQCLTSDNYDVPLVPVKTADGALAYATQSQLALHQGELLSIRLADVNHAVTCTEFRISTFLHSFAATYSQSQSVANASNLIAGAGAGASNGPQSTSSVTTNDPLVPNPNYYPLNQAEFDLIKDTNMARAQSGLSPLIVDSALMNGACVTAQMNASNNAPIARDSNSVYENVSYDQNAYAAIYGSTEGLGWMGDAKAKANMLNPNITKIGTCVAYSQQSIPEWVEEML